MVGYVGSGALKISEVVIYILGAKCKRKCGVIPTKNFAFKNGLHYIYIKTLLTATELLGVSRRHIDKCHYIFCIYKGFDFRKCGVEINSNKVCSAFAV